jgi:hypothetical protein
MPLDRRCSGEGQRLVIPPSFLSAQHRRTVESGNPLQAHFGVVALVDDGRALVSAVARLSPDVIVTDLLHAHPRRD